MTFFHLDEFPEFKTLQDNHGVIRHELSRISRWASWGSDDGDAAGHCRFQSGNWTVFPVYVGRNVGWDSFIHLRNSDRPLFDNLFSRLPATFPQMTEMLDEIPRIKWSGFSRLGAQSELTPHRHTNPGSLIYHLGVVIPPHRTAGLMVEDRVHLWEKEGDAVIFDDNRVHHAWNHSDSERIVLYINFATEQPSDRG